MTEQELQELKEILSKGTPTQWQLFNKVAVLLDEVESLRKQVEFNRKYGIHSNAMKEIERLRKVLDQALNELFYTNTVLYRKLTKELEVGIE